MRKILIAIPLLAALISCHNDDDPKVETAQRTIFVYMAAENNLTDYATEDLEEMKTASRSLSDDQKLVVYVDRSGSAKTPFIARVCQGELRDTIYMPEGIAADPTVLKNVLSRAKTLYPAKSYGLVLWGHASGWIVTKNDTISKNQSRAYGGSTGNNSSSGSGKYWMNIPQMSDAIAAAMGTDKLSFIFGDCCSFGAIEVAYELRHLTDYVLGSPAEIPDMGAPFDQTIIDMFRETADFYQQIIDNYYNYYIDVYKTKQNKYYNKTAGDLAGYSVPLVAIKTSELENLAQATSTILGTIADKLTPTGDLSFSKVMYYAYYDSYRYSYDMNNMLKANTDSASYSEWKKSYDLAVPYSLYSAKWMSNFSRLISDMNNFEASEEDCGCVSMFFPNSMYVYTSPNWNTAIQLFEWNNVIRWQQYNWE